MKAHSSIFVLALLSYVALVHGAGLPAASSKTPRSVRAGQGGSSLEQLAVALEKMKGARPDKAAIGQVAAMWKDLPESHKEALKGDIVSLSCAGFLAIGDADSFGKARSAIVDIDAFRRETTERCPGCGGTGIVKTRCSSCGGSGRCSRCHGRGSISAPRLQGMGSAASMSCSSCHGSGRCVECKGGTKEIRHQDCNGSGSRMSREKSMKAFELHRSHAESYLKNEIRRKKEEAFAAEQRAKGLVLRDGKWMSPKEIEELDRKLQEEKRKAEEEKRLAEERKKKEEEFAASQRAKGFVWYDGRWLTKDELAEVKRRERFASLLANKSLYDCPYQVLQVFDDGQALCVNMINKQVFCLHFNQSINRSVADGNQYRNNLYWCGTYTYTTVQNASKRVNLYAIDMEEAIMEARRQGYDED